MKTLKTGGVTYIQPVPGGTNEWYYGLGRAQGDLYEAEELFRAGKEVRGDRLLLIRFPEGTVYEPSASEAGVCLSEPVYCAGGVCFLRVDFPAGRMKILRFDCVRLSADTAAELPLPRPGTATTWGWTSPPSPSGGRAARTACSRSSGRKGPASPWGSMRAFSCGTGTSSSSAAGTRRGRERITVIGRRPWSGTWPAGSRRSCPAICRSCPTGKCGT